MGYRLRVVSNFGDGDCGAGEIHTRAREKFRGDATRREGSAENLIFGAPFASRRLEISLARVCVFRPPHNRHRQN